MTALLGLIAGMFAGIAARELWARRPKDGLRTALLFLVLLLAWSPVLWMIVQIFLKHPPG